MFGVNKNKNKNKTVEEDKEKPLYGDWIGYMGGHKAHPSPGNVQIFFYNDRNELSPLTSETPINLKDNIDDVYELFRRIHNIVTHRHFSLVQC